MSEVTKPKPAAEHLNEPVLPFALSDVFTLLFYFNLAKFLL